MKADFNTDKTIEDFFNLRETQMLFANPEYQRGAVWNETQQKKLIDSIFRGYPIPLIYLHKIKQEAGGLKSERYEIIDGQQRINAIYNYLKNGFSLYDPIKDERTARFPNFVKNQPCPWGGKKFSDLDSNLKDRFKKIKLPVVEIETGDNNEARDLFVRLQAGSPLSPQEKRDAWPGNFTRFILELGGKPEMAHYQGHNFFKVLMQADRVKDRGKFRQLAAQMAMLYFKNLEEPGKFCDIKSVEIDDYYYQNLDFDMGDDKVHRLLEILNKLVDLLGDKKRSKIVGHEAIHLLLFVSSIWDSYTRSWEDEFAKCFDSFRAEVANARKKAGKSEYGEYYLNYAQKTQTSSDKADIIKSRHEFFCKKMSDFLSLVPKDTTRLYGQLDKEIIYSRDGKKCAVCGSEVSWQEGEIHHVEPHHKGGKTILENGVLVHRHCHPKNDNDVQKLKEKLLEKIKSSNSTKEITLESLGL